MRFFSRGKLLISGEYLVLKGATALAFPLKKGQGMEVTQSGTPGELVWESREYGNTWFSARFKLPFFEIVQSSDGPIGENLVNHFNAMVAMDPGFVEKVSGASVVTDLDFNRSWGFGSSSSLLSNLSWWAGIDPFKLHQRLSSGSGYDVVCAREQGPVLFRLLKKQYITEQINLSEALYPHIYFVYLGTKEDSSRHVKDFLSRTKQYTVEKRMVSELGRHMAAAKNIEDFGFYMKEHELVISSVLKQPTLKEGIFSDLAGEAKSLGAWGGDFAMITWTGTSWDLAKYLASKNLNTHFSFSELIKTR